MNAIAPAPAAVPLGKLDASPLNARRTRRAAGIGELAASIAAHGLLQSLVVRPRKGGRFEVVAGGRRHAALLLLASRKELPRNAAIPCRVLDGEDGAAAEASLAENAVRLDMHPADQFDAFAALHRGGEGLGAEEIAARFGVTPAVVRQRLRLAAAAPAVLAAYRGGELTLDEVTAFAATEDRDVQERVLRDLLPWQRTPAAIRRLVTEALVPLSDRRVLLVGVDAYERAGGLVHRDLFGAEGEGWIADPALLERLAGERMEEEAARLRAEGWRWVALGDAAGAEAWRCRRVWPVRRPLTGEEEERRAALAERQDALWAEHGDDELPDAAADELAHIEAELDALDGREEAWRAEDVAVAGCALALGSDGVPRATRGLVRPEDEPACPAAEGRAAFGAPDEEDAAPAAGAERDSAGKGREPALPAALEAELDAHRTLGLRAALAERPDLALRVLVHSMAGDAFGERWGEAVARFQPSAPAFAGNAALAGCPARRALEEAEATARASLPADRRDLWRWTGGQGTEALLRVLAVCVARGANGGSGDWPADGLHAAVAREAGLDMRRWWTAAEPEAFLARVPKAAVLAAVREGAGEEAARRVSGWKKAPMAAEAALLLGAAGWLPNRLRVPDAPANDGGTAEAAVAAE